MNYTRIQKNNRRQIGFDGKTKTKASGIVCITTGAGGAGLYDPGFDDSPEKWLHDEDKRVAYVSRVVSSQHSCTVLEVTAKELTLTQIGEKGDILDTNGDRNLKRPRFGQSQKTL